MTTIYDYQVLSALHLILEDYETNNDKEDLAYNLKNLIDVIENHEVISEYVVGSVEDIV